MSSGRTGRVVILGAGQAGLQTAAALRDEGFEGEVMLLGDEPHPPYQRPPLSKAFLKGAIESDRLYLRPQTFYADRNIDLRLGTRVGRIDPHNRRVETTDGKEIAFGKLVIATGTRPRVPQLPGRELGRVFTLRSIADVEAVRPAVSDVDRVAIVGGGYIGLEAAAVLRELGKVVTIVEAEDRLLKRVTSHPVSQYFDALHRAHGVDVVTGVRVAGLIGESNVAGVVLACGRTIPAGAVLLAIGALPNVEIADDAGIATGDGILVDAHGRTSAPDVFACGDCARFPSRRYARSLRIESVQNAIDQAKCSAATIAGRPMAHDPVPWFWSDQYRTKLQIAGLFDPTDTVSVEGEPGEGPFAVEYRRGGRLVAVDAIDNARAHMLARRRIAEDTSRDATAPAIAQTAQT